MANVRTNYDTSRNISPLDPSIASPADYDFAPESGDSQSPLTSVSLGRSNPRTPVSGRALVVRSLLRTDRNSRPYLALTLRLAEGTVIDARWWQFPYPANQCPVDGAVWCFTGFADSFNGLRQFRIVDAQPVPDADLAPFAIAINRPFAELIVELDTIISRLDQPMAELVNTVLSGETLTRFCSWPAAQQRHGAVRHGLLAHSLRVADLAVRLAEAYAPEQLSYDRSLLIAAALLHDIGKVRALPAIAGSAIPEAGTRFDHVTLGILMIQQAAMSLDPQSEPARLDALLHAILAHHGRPEWGTPVEPQTAEAWLLHLADLAEARLWSYSNQADTPQTPIAVPARL